MKIVIALVAVILVLFGAFKIWEYWDKVSHDKDIAEQEEARRLNVSSDSLPGMPDELRKSYDIAKNNGPEALGKWLKSVGPKVDDPRRASIELDYVVGIAGSDIQEAKRVFGDVRARTPETSPLYPRIKALEKTYQ